jgi:transcriptional regulator with XRE-family HTH domain
MATSQQKSKVARIRLIAGETAEAFADIIGKSISTLRSLESGRLKLSEQTASEISGATGVSFTWLMSGENSDPICSGRKPVPLFTTDKYIAHRAKKRSPASRWGLGVHGKLDAFFLADPVQQIISSICRAEEEGNGDIALYHLEKFAADLSKLFPSPKNKERLYQLLVELGDSISVSGETMIDDGADDDIPEPKPQKKQPSRKSKRPA